ncbi:hypothetical protein ACFW04_013061 [Cataglyphis niger]
MGIRVIWKEDLNTTSAELMYAKLIRLPGQFLIDNDKTYNNNEDINYAHILNEKATFTFNNKETKPIVFVRHDALTGALQQLYDEAVNISIDRLKSTYSLEKETPQSDVGTITPTATPTTSKDGNATSKSRRT